MLLLDPLDQFLVNAKTSAYASGAEEKKIKDGSKELVYEEGDFRYRDRYFGFNPFCGQEIVWQKGEAIWAMNYHGQIILNAADTAWAKSVYGFLRKALKKVTNDRPFRGPAYFQDGEFRYINSEITGDVSRFNGTERIFYAIREIYKLYFHGGLIKK